MYKVYFYACMFINNMFMHISTPTILLVLTIVSELLNPLKIYPEIYFLKVCIDIPKEIIKFNLMFGMYTGKEGNA
jgi:hypothetical protein